MIVSLSIFVLFKKKLLCFKGEEVSMKNNGVCNPYLSGDEALPSAVNTK